MVLLNIELKFSGLLSIEKKILLTVGELPPFHSNRLLKVEIASIPKEDIGCVHNIKKLRYFDKSCRWLDDGLRETKT